MNNYNWNLSLIYKDSSEIQEDMQKVNKFLDEYDFVKDTNDIEEL